MRRTVGRPAMRVLQALVLGTSTLIVPASRGEAQRPPPTLTAFLEQTIALDQGDMRAVTSGTAVVKVLQTSDEREIAVFGVVRIDVPRSFYVHSVTDFPASLRNPSRLAFALFSDPAAMADVQAVSVPHDDVQDVARCRPGACQIKLSAADITHLRATVDFGSPAADSVVSAYFRERMTEYVNAYRAQGDSALIVYGDQEPTAAAGQVFQLMLSRSPYMYQYAPSLERYLVSYPRDRPAGLFEVLFWAEDNLPGLKPTVTITHEVVYAPPELPGSTLIASKLLYAAHYLDGALDLTAVVDQTGDQGADAAGIYLVLLRHWHFDELPSGGLLNVRGRVIGKLRDQTTASLRDAKASSERAYAHAPDSAR